jgi:hypothetical protein
MDLDLAAVDPLWLAVAAGVLLLVIVTIVVALVRRRRRRAQLQDRYGPEYRRAVDEAGSRRAADRDLLDREERRRSFELRPLSQDERDRFRARWEDLQASFVDSPAATVRRADELIDDVADEVGYPKADRDQRMADLSVDHPATIDEYRKGRPSDPDAERGPTTEQLRQALLSSRSLFEAVLGRDAEDVGIPPAPFRELEGTDGAERLNGDRAGERHVAKGRDPRTDATVGTAGTDDRTDRTDERVNVTDERVNVPADRTDENDVRQHEPAEHRTATSPVLGPDGRPLPHDGRDR